MQRVRKPTKKNNQAKPDEKVKTIKSVKQKSGAGGKDFITMEQLDAKLTPWMTKIDSVIGSMAARQQIMSGNTKRTDAEIMEINEKQITDAQNINKRNAGKIPMVVGTEKYDENYLFRNVRPGMSKKDTLDEIQKVLSNPTDSETMKEFQFRMDRMKIRCVLMSKPGQPAVTPKQTEAWAEHEAFLNKTGIAKILSTGSVGADFVPEGWSMELLGYYYAMLQLGSVFSTFPMPHNPFTYPIIGRPRAYRRTTPTSSARGASNEKKASDPRTNRITFDAEKIITRTDLHDDLVEDSVDMLLDDLMRVHIPEAMVQGVENAIVNGDTESTHQDNGLDSDDTAYCWDGLRRIALQRSATVDIEASSGLFDYSDFSRVLERGGHYLSNPNETAWVLPTTLSYRVTSFDQVETMDKFNMPTNMHGVVNIILGRPVFVSNEYPENLDSTGVISDTDANNTKTGFSAFNHMLFKMGERRVESVMWMYDQLTDFYYLSADCRKDFQAMEDRRDGFTPVASAVNVSTAS